MKLSELNNLPGEQLIAELTKCCGSSKWVHDMTLLFPIPDEATLLNEAELTWNECDEEDWKEAFAHHPKIGDLNSLKAKFASTSQWAEGEQAGVKATTQQVLEELAQGNKEYEEKYGYIFIVFATGKSAEEMLSMLKLRLLNTPEDEIKIAMEEQNKITRQRLKKLLS